MLITALGVAILTGIYAACKDMYHSADQFYDKQNLYDIRIVSTLGLTKQDVEALGSVGGIDKIMGAYSETVQTDVNASSKDAEVSVLSAQEMNTPYLLEGNLPMQSGEIAVTQAYIQDTGKKIGDSVEIAEQFEEDAEDKGEQKAETKTDSDVDLDIDSIEIEEKEAPTFALTKFTISGIVLDPMDISNKGMSFRSAATADYTFFINGQDAAYDIYTSVYITLEGLEGLSCYSDEYISAVQGVVTVIEDKIMSQREQARYDEVLAEGLEKITDAENTMNDKFAEADEKFEDAWKELEDAKKDLLGGQATLSKEEKDALQKLAEAHAELESGKAQLKIGEADLAAGEAEIASNEQKLASGKQTLLEEKQAAEALFEDAEHLMEEKQDELTQTANALLPAIEQLKSPFGALWPQAEWDALVTAAGVKTTELLAANPEAEPDFLAVVAATTTQQKALAAALQPLIEAWGLPEDPAILIGQCTQAGIALGILNAGQQMLNMQRAALEQQKEDALQQFAQAENELADAQVKIDVAKIQIQQARAQLTSGWADIATGEETLNKEEAAALRKLADAWREIADGKKELASGETELQESEQEYKDKKAEAQEKLAEAYAKLDDIDIAEWYVQDRSAIESYSSLKSDMSSIETLGNVFPVIFLVVAVLISLTTMTRMVEEERDLIGTYKAMGFGNAAIYAKYILYALISCLLGGLLGDVLGFVVLPTILIGILQEMYTLPHIYLAFDFVYGIGGILLFVVSIVGATAFTCRKELAHTPAALMRPKAPKAGSRIALERLPFVWNKIGFLNKVTARNLFRYKKRLLMTILGIMGCTALVLTGFAIKDSVTDLMPKQYEETYQYDLMVVTNAEDNETWTAGIKTDENIADYVNLKIETAKLIGPDASTESVQMMVIPRGTSIDGYINIQSTNEEKIDLESAGLFVTQNAAEMLGLKAGDNATLQNMQLERGSAPVSAVVQNYLGNNVYITQDLYETMFGEYKPNAVLAHLAASVHDQAEYAESLLGDDAVLSSVSTQALKADFSTNFTMINSVVYILIILAAGLAFVVLFTLSSTNISERMRELATIKVLGFFDNEVHSYVNKETIILTIIGVLLGLPAGRFISGLLTSVLKMPSLYFAVHVNAVSYLIAALLSLCFAVIVNLITNKSLDKIDMVEALKSVE
ncbi:MAG: FtsX-like permease family protein [Oscillospiraceae bacterium]